MSSHKSTFDPLSSNDPKTKEFLNKLKIHQRTLVQHKSTLYNFDFVDGHPFKESATSEHRFHWEPINDKKKNPAGHKRVAPDNSNISVDSTYKGSTEIDNTKSAHARKKPKPVRKSKRRPNAKSKRSNSGTRKKAKKE